MGVKTEVERNASCEIRHVAMDCCLCLHSPPPKKHIFVIVGATIFGGDYDDDVLENSCLQKQRTCWSAIYKEMRKTFSFLKRVFNTKKQ
jgi:hypothetical protein